MLGDGVRWGILGTGKIANILATALAGCESGELVAVGSRDAERSRAFAATFGVPRAYGTYEEVIDDDGVDLVYVATHHPFHRMWAVTAADAGKHVLCEKPIGLSADEARRMADAGRRTGRVLVEAFMYRLHPTWITACRLAASGQIGEVRAVQSWFSFIARDPADIRNLAACGGGAMLDIGCYCVNLSRMLMGEEPTGVSAAVRRETASGVDVLAAGILEFGDRLASFGVSIRAEPDQRVVVYGTEGRILIEVPFNIPGDRPTRVLVWRGSALPTDAPEVLSFPPANMYTLQAEAFAATVLDGAPPAVPTADSVANMAVIDRILGAAS